jgi:hypothetical protein
MPATLLNGGPMLNERAIGVLERSDPCKLEENARQISNNMPALDL